MDYALDFYLGPTSDVGTNPNPRLSFIYEDHRFFSKMYVLLKSFGLFFYITTLTRCANPEIYIIMNGIMCLSTVNSARYEYRHYQRFGTVFTSIEHYDAWKQNLWPKSRFVFSITELIVKIGYFIYTFPLQFEFSSVCGIGKSILIIHMFFIFSIYLISCLFTSWLYCCGHCYGNPGTNSISHQTPVSATFTFPTTNAPPPDKECCICLDAADAADAARQWIRLPCAHIFHGACITQWLLTHDTCPVCRLNVRSLH